ncbi:MAG TPA: TIM barrel protein [Acidisarcina sp.]
MSYTRRELVGGLGMVGLGAALSPVMRALPSGTADGRSACPFRLAVINDEISQDFELACKTVSQDFGLGWIELRGMWDKNISALTAKEIEDARKILAEHKLRVSDIASPLFKTDWPGAPRSPQSETRDQFHADFDADAQDKLLEHLIPVAKSFDTDRIRCFDYWRLTDAKPYRAAINARLQSAAVRCAKDNIILLLENEMSCNTATGEEAAAVLAAVPNKNFMLNWDPGNAAALGSTPFPDGYGALPKHRIGHCHAKDVVRKADGKYEWAPVGAGVVDWVGQFQAFKRDHYRHVVSLETHWRGAGTPEASTRISMKGLKKTLVVAGAGCS